MAPHFEAIKDWFEKHEREMSLAERREAFQTLVIVGGESCRDFLLAWAMGEQGPSTQAADTENRLCAILALGRLSSDESIAALQKLCESSNQTISVAAREALASD